MKKSLVPIYAFIALLGATALWYFGHHRPAQQILNAEPKHVYTSAPITPKIATQESQTHPHSHTHDDQVGDLHTQTATPPTTEHNPDIARTDTMDTDAIVESQTAMEINDDTPHEQHSHSPEEAAAERAENEAKRAERAAFRKSAQEYLENAEITKLQMASETSDFLNTMSVEEQHAYFKMCENIVYNDIPRLHPGEDTQEDLDRLWNSVLSSLIVVGYTPPEGVDLK